MTKLDVTFLANVKSKLELAYKSNSNPVDVILDSVLELGFNSVRYWMIAQNDIDKETHFVLSKAKKPGNNQFLQEKYGYTIEHTRCSIFPSPPKNFHREKTKSRVYQHSKSAMDDYILGVNDDLGLVSRNFIHIPISSHGKLHGQLSCSYDDIGGIESFSDEALSGLGILGMLFGDYKQLHSERKLRTAIDRFEKQEENLVKRRDTREALSLIAELIKDLVSAEFVTVFNYNWYEERLTSVCNTMTKFEGLNENIELNQYLTGKAYTKEKYRYVFSLSELSKRHPHLINREVSSHFLKGKKSGSVAYGLIGKREHKCLIRVFNKANDDRVPLDYFERDALEQACIYFSKAYDDILTYSQLDRLQRVSSEVVDSISNVKTVCSTVSSSLVDEWVDEIVMFGKPDDSEFVDIYFKKNKRDFEEISISYESQNNFFSQCLDVDEIGWVAVSSLGDLYKNIREKFISNGYVGMLVFNNHMLDFRGGLGIPLTKQPRLGKGLANIPKLHRSNVASYSSILSKLMYFVRNSLATDNALNLLGTLGHEFKSPMRKMKGFIEEFDATTKSVLMLNPGLADLKYTTMEHVLMPDKVSERAITVEKSYLKYISEATSIVSNLHQQIKITTNTAAPLALISDGIIDMTFAKHDVKLLMQSVIRDVENEIDVLQGERYLSCLFELNHAFDNLDSLICDKFLISKVFENIVRNALKYSVPPGNGDPIEITVHANPQPERLDIIVGNWGTPIHEPEKENIFRPFYRPVTSSKDKIQARKGMGLGLHISRTLARAHRGEVKLMHSKPTFGDPSRRFKEGYKTQFLISISKSLIKGTFSYNMQSGQLNPTNFDLWG